MRAFMYLICPLEKKWRPEENRTFLHDYAGVQDQMVVMAVEREETGDGWDEGVAAGLTNKLQVLNPPPKLILAHPKVLQEVSYRNTELLVESPKTFYRRLNLDLNVPKS